MANATAEKKKTNIFQRIIRYIRDIIGEMKRVVWPSRKQTVNNTIIVTVFMIIMAVVIGAFDAGLSALVKLVFGSGA